MPPRGHSSSHHSSSHHSSHSSSHRSVSRSSHSSSHHSYSSSHHSYPSGGSSYSRSPVRKTAPAERTRTSQPYGWDTSRGTVFRYRGKTHDYDYYPQDWTTPDGHFYAEGYYDENGQHYPNLVLSGGTTILKCAYCGNRMVYEWKEGNIPTCDKCGAQFQISITDQAVKADEGSTGSAKRKLPLAWKIAIAVIIASFVLPGITLGGIIAYLGLRQRQNPDDALFREISEVNTIYVEELGRNCYRDGEDWYDAPTECWFYYNDDVAPYQWQYWYEGISSDYGDYGWMEYDMGESTWYVEADDGNWVHLPDSYDTSKLWHMTDEYINPYE